MPASIAISAGALAAAGLVGAAAGCEPSAPANPSWQVDVMPILAARCVRCHGYPNLEGAPHDLRFDSYDDVQVEAPPARKWQGAGLAAFDIEGRIQAKERPMPPRFGLDPWELDTLLAWTSQGTVQVPPPRGAPRPDNQPPVLALQELGRDATTVTLAYDLHDPDGDLVVGQLCEEDGDTCVFVAPLQSGHGEVRLDTTTFTPPVTLRAKLDDGAGELDQAAGLVEAP
ncbi:MAG TPA: hypothetical protein VHE35_13715 [Kofleriaceae bacterium]|nr:hypothetical protein [Kofleriaceae bacterium]